MSAQFWQGKQSIRLDEPVYINGNASVVGKKEGEGPLGLLFDMVGEDDMFGCNTWEEAESSLQKDAVSLALGKAGKRQRRYAMFLREICSDNPSQPPSAL